ncbi:hypothetical protein L7F22_011032 [Adiantum nelumboides]|nr:hypothetical protein [Adiantum nelumboides]
MQQNGQDEQADRLQPTPPVSPSPSPSCQQAELPQPHENKLSPASSGTLRWRRIFLSPVQAFHCLSQQQTQPKSMDTLCSSSSCSSRSPSIRINKVKLRDLHTSSKRWLRHPQNLALSLWCLAVVVSGAMLFLIMVGWLDHAIRPRSRRDLWFEVNNQILNALFALMCLYLHPRRLLHLFLLYRWNADDIKNLRDVYCKDGICRPHEWCCMLVVVLLLNLNCFAQYALCGLNWGYRSIDRPVVGVVLCFAVAMGSPAVAGMFTFLSPLGRDY